MRYDRSNSAIERPPAATTLPRARCRAVGLADQAARLAGTRPARVRPIFRIAFSLRSPPPVPVAAGWRRGFALITQLATTEIEQIVGCV
jgi:hypothetical protein